MAKQIEQVEKAEALSGAPDKGGMHDDDDDELVEAPVEDLEERDDLDGDEEVEACHMPKEVMQMVQNRMKETQKDKKTNQFDQSDMYLQDFKKSFG